MAERPVAKNPASVLATKRVETCGIAVLVAVLSTAACQGMDRLERDEVVVAVGVGADGGDRGTILDTTAGPDYGSGGRLTEEIAQRRVREIRGTHGEERLALATRFLREYPMGEVIAELHELMGDAYSELGDPVLAAEAWERALEMSWPPNDLLGLPQTNIELPYQIGWAHSEAGNPTIGADWLTRATLISDRSQLEQGLRFIYAELGSPGDDFGAWFSGKQAGTAVQAPDFELPGYGFDSLRLSDVGARLTLINFWTPT